MNLYDGNYALLSSIAFMAAGALSDFALGVRRCNDCHAEARCREWRASGRTEGYETFCPNAAFIERTKVFARR